jgi:DNA/RNA endonuclease G (NUC1)
MKKFYFFLAVLSLITASFYRSASTAAQSVDTAGDATLVSPNVVISQFQPGGDIANDEFIELHNIGPLPVDLNGYRVVYRSAAGTTDVGPFATWSVSTILQPGQFYLIGSLAYDGAVTPDVTWNTQVGSMGAGGGGLAIRPTASGTPVDSVGWGTATNAFIETAATAAPGNNNGQARKAGGCQDTDNNSADFATNIPSAPRNSASTPVVCNGGGATLFASMSANPSTVAQGGMTLLTVTVLPATEPPSTNITVTGNLSDIGGSAVQQFFDNGTNGDVTPGDNVYSYRATIPVSVPGGAHVVSALVTDAQGRTAQPQQNIIVNGPPDIEDPLLLGNPSGATTDVANENNYLMIKPQYSLSYSRSKATPNWTAWRLDSSWLGSAPRQDDFRPDPTLPTAWYHVTDGDYSGSGYSRGHMCPSGDRTRSIPDNSATFLMTNMIPQLAANNEGPWADLETYCRTLASGGNEVYIVSGPSGNIGTIAQGRVVVPSVTWKVVLVLPNGNNDLGRISKSTRAFGVIMSNQSITLGNQWRNYRVTVDAVEYLTGYNFFSAVPKNTQEIIERRRDRQ